MSEKLRAAVNNNDVDGCFSLLRRGADPNLGDSKHRMPLHFATTKNNPQLLRVLLQHGADPNIRDANGNTPLHLAACTSNTKMITLLLNAGCDPNARDGELKDTWESGRGEKQSRALLPFSTPFVQQ